MACMNNMAAHPFPLMNQAHPSILMAVSKSETVIGGDSDSSASSFVVYLYQFPINLNFLSLMSEEEKWQAFWWHWRKF